MSDHPREVGQRLARGLQAGVRGFMVETRDESRAVRMLEHVGQALTWPVHTWSTAGGFDGREPLPLTACLERAGEMSADELWLLLDGNASLTNPRDRRLLRELCQRTRGPAVVLVGPDATGLGNIPELVHEHLALPSADEISREINEIIAALPRGRDEIQRFLDEHRETIARMLIGFDLSAVERVLAECIVDCEPHLAAIEIAVIGHKARTLREGGLLEPITPPGMAEVGGMPTLKAWLARRALALAPAAAQVGIPTPRGVLLVGISGCGKSLAARACADALGLPLLRLDPGRLFGSTVGESESNLRRACECVERLAPVTMWIDEIDKSLAGSDGAASDAGTTARVVGALLTWLQERERPVFVVTTANRVDRLPPELLRRGRLDETFFVDLPSAEEREAITRIHLYDKAARVSGKPPPCADDWSAYADVARTADGFSGAELEAALVEARLDAFADARPIAAADFARAIAATVPLSRSHPEPIAALRRWAEHGARRA